MENHNAKYVYEMLLYIHLSLQGSFTVGTFSYAT